MYKQTLVEMQNEFARWGAPTAILPQMHDYLVNHLQFKTQLSNRTAEVRNHIQTNFALPGQVDVTLDVYPPDAGKILISTITPDSYPWQGIYFNGIPVKIEAIANSGFGFLHWGSNPLIADTMNSVFVDTLNAEITNFTAFFGDFTSAKAIDKKSDFILYPNPAKEKLNILYSGKACFDDFKYRIFDLNGRIITDGILSGRSKISVINLPDMQAGVYLLTIYGGDGTTEHLRFITTR